MHKIIFFYSFDTTIFISQFIAYSLAEMKPNEVKDFPLIYFCLNSWILCTLYGTCTACRAPYREGLKGGVIKCSNKITFGYILYKAELLDKAFKMFFWMIQYIKKKEINNFELVCFGVSGKIRLFF